MATNIGRDARKAGLTFGHWVALLVLGVLTLFPLYFMAVTGLKNGAQLSANQFNVAVAPPFGNFYVTAWQYLSGDFVRTGLVIFPSLLGITAVAMMSAYAFARMEFLGRGFLFYLVFGLLLIPSFLTLIPLFLEVKGMGLENNLLALILPYIAGGQAFAIFVFRAFISAIPEELFEAARIDGASHGRMLWSIALPLSVPIIIAVALLNLTTFYGDYVFPSLVLDPAHSTIAMAIGNFQPPPAVAALDVVNLQFAAYTIVSVPLIVIFIIFLRYFLAGMTSGALKM